MCDLIDKYWYNHHSINKQRRANMTIVFLSVIVAAVLALVVSKEV